MLNNHAVDWQDVADAVGGEVAKIWCRYMINQTLCEADHPKIVAR